MTYDIYLPAACGRFQDSPAFQVNANSMGELIEAVSLEIARRNLSIAGFLKVKDPGSSADMRLAFIDQLAALTRGDGCRTQTVPIH